ncbi:MAG: hypothetical protein P8Z72_12700 [Gammaproteobacteria bacterium]|jgi:hypothetical protein
MNVTSIMFVIGSLLALFILYLNVAATIWLVRTDDLNHFQKLGQGMTVWLLPYLGARLVLSLLRETDPASLPRSMLGYRSFGWLDTANSRNDAWTGDNTHSTHHHDSCGHDSGSGGHSC